MQHDLIKETDSGEDRLKDSKPNQTQFLLIMNSIHDCDVVVILLDSLCDGLKTQ